MEKRKPSGSKPKARVRAPKSKAVVEEDIMVVDKGSEEEEPKPKRPQLETGKFLIVFSF